MRVEEIAGCERRDTELGESNDFIEKLLYPRTVSAAVPKKKVFLKIVHTIKFDS